MKIFHTILFFTINSAFVFAQTDSVKILDQIVVKAFAYEKPLLQVPASVAVLSSQELNRFNNTSILPTLNTIPGVRMEERSPGSFRLAIRGSSLRSPFGIRNVKFYWNGLPMTDGGGNTYLNLLDFNSVQQIEVIKGPSGSLYGAGMGGVLLLTSPKLSNDEVQITASAGGFGLQRYQINGAVRQKKVAARIQFAHQQSDGYREQTALRRDALNLDLQFQVGRSSILRSAAFYTDLYYQTPGGLTKAQYGQDPKQARPESGNVPGAVQQQTAVFNKTFYTGLMWDHQWNTEWSTQAGLFVSTTDFINPAINSFEKRNENNWGGRLVNKYHFFKELKSSVTFGGEFQLFNSPINNFQNTQGTPGNLLFSDELRSGLATLFAQVEFQLPMNFSATLGASGNFVTYRFNRTSTPTPIEQHRNFDPLLIPRVALLKKINEQFSVHGSISKGFSPPTLAEVRPSTNTYNDSLKAETGINYEVGARGDLLKHFSFDITLYSLQLNETIVVRQIDNADYFVNSGGTSQLGAEVMLSYRKIFSSSLLSSIKIWSNYTRNNFTFNRYIKNQQDYSYQSLTGTAPYAWVGGFDVNSRSGFYLDTTLTNVDAIPLNDANTDFASGYFTVAVRLGYSSVFNTMPFDVWIGADNITDEKYSLGNDLNAAGGRYYNAAATRSFFAGVTIRLAEF